MSIVDKTYFIGDINLPTDDISRVNKLNQYIDIAQSKYLLKGLGYELYQLFIDDLPTPTEERFTDLLEGKEYTDLNGNLCKWSASSRSSNNVRTDKPI